MMMSSNTIDFLRSTAEFMAKDRPDIYDVQTAITDLVTMMDKMRGMGEPTWTSFASYILMLHYEGDDVEEWNFTRKVSSLTIFEEEGEVLVVGYTKNSGALKYGVDLPDVLDDDLGI
jgi:hypothetical protein